MLNLEPCPYRLVDGDGHILCHQIKTGDREVSPALCRACPIAQINCLHLRATLDQQTRVPITVRWGNGKSQIWDDPTPPLALQRAACSAKTIPILSPRDCAGCALRQTFVMPQAIPLMPKVERPRAARAPRAIPASSAPTFQPVPAPAAASTVSSSPSGEARSNIVAQKILQLQEWLTKQKHPKVADEEPAEILPIAMGARPLRVAEERRVGWTD